MVRATDFQVEGGGSETALGVTSSPSVTVL